RHDQRFNGVYAVAVSEDGVRAWAPAHIRHSLSCSSVNADMAPHYQLESRYLLESKFPISLIAYGDDSEEMVLKRETIIDACPADPILRMIAGRWKTHVIYMLGRDG